jgi:protoheme IX farnesyltransferase
VFAGSALLVASSLLPIAYGMGTIYAVGAGAGGALFLRATWALAKDPGKDTARASFKASLAQLTLVLVAAIADRLA